MAKAPVYEADDRSLLLPHYKRWLVEPTLRFIPARVHPNVITHAGHLFNLAAIVLLVALRPSRGWIFLASMALLQFYCWADNADGAHARRTKQSSAFGEFLDHGLDVLNTTYIGLMTIYTLGSGPGYAIALAILIPGAAATTCWEQTETGVFRMGLLNQIESIVVLSATMVVSGIYGTHIWRELHLGPVTAYDFFHLWPIATISFGMLRSIARVYAAKRSIAPELAFLGIHGLIAATALTHAVPTVVAVAFAVAVNIFYGMRMLSLRLQGGHARVEALFVIGSVALTMVLLGAATGHTLDSPLGAALAVGACVIYGFSSLQQARDGVITLERIEASR